MADMESLPRVDRLELLAERLIAQLGDRAWEVARAQRDQAVGQARDSWTIIADRIAARR